MPGSGTTSFAWTREPGFNESPTDPTYVVAGRNPDVQELSLQNALARSRLPDDNEAIESIAQQLSGALTIAYDLVHPWALTDAFVSAPSGTPPEWTMGSGQMPSSRWYIGLDVKGSVTERELKGAATTSLQVQINQNAPARVTQTIVYADEAKNSSLTPGDIVGRNESPYMFHGATFTLDGTTQKKMQEATLEIPNGGTLDYGWNRKPVDAIAGDADYTLSASKIVTEETDTNVAMAYGGSAATEPVSDSSVDAVSGEIPLTRGDGDEITFSLTDVSHNNYNWENIPPTGEERAQESLELHVNRVSATADVSMADPFA